MSIPKMEFPKMEIPKMEMKFPNQLMDLSKSRKQQMDESSSKRIREFKRAISKSKSRHSQKMKELVSPLSQVKRQLRRLFKYYYRRRHELQAPIFFSLWISWLLAGSLFYAYAPKSQLGLMKGFYMALNIGYSIGFGFPSEDSNNYLYFSSMYVLIGASFVGMALGFFAEKISKDSDTWFTRMEQKQRIEKAMRAKESRLWGNIQAIVHHAESAFKALAVWLLFVVIMIVYSMMLFDYPFREAQYFAISSLSTGGHWSIPDDSPDWIFGVTGLLIMFGVPVMALAMAQTAYTFISTVDIDEAKSRIEAVVTKDELVILHDLGMEDGDGEIDQTEFIILCMIRMGTDLGLIKYIIQRFNELNFYTGEPLSIKQLTQGACEFVDGHVRRRQSVQIKPLQVVSEHEATIVVDDDFTFARRDSLLSDSSFGFSTGGRSSLQSIDETYSSRSFRRTRISFADEVEDLGEEKEEVTEEMKEVAESPPEHDAASSSSTTLNESAQKESTFLRRLIDKLGIQSSDGGISCETTDPSSADSNTSHDIFLDEMELGMSQRILNPVKRFVDGLSQECPSETSDSQRTLKRSTRVEIGDISDTLQLLLDQNTPSVVNGSRPPVALSVASGFQNSVQSTVSMGFGEEDTQAQCEPDQRRNSRSKIQGFHSGRPAGLSLASMVSIFQPMGAPAQRKDLAFEPIDSVDENCSETQQHLSSERPKSISDVKAADHIAGCSAEDCTEPHYERESQHRTNRPYKSAEYTASTSKAATANGLYQRVIDLSETPT